ncbi:MULTISPECIES: hypothetical protein [Streptomyces]|uniref:Transposase n=1 Tax=Streptomyces doebereineriae TaxID=3075528 RepID=A0ABU2V1D1_9ACTN|nr:hypothetical protein [Streptomyces sp. DSM 41640]MDT0479363.1 hypothetical protein [Streptomyces sp. DSM 41640]
MAAAALGATERQHTALPGDTVSARVVHTLAKEVLELSKEIAEIDKLTAARLRAHGLAEVMGSMPVVALHEPRQRAARRVAVTSLSIAPVAGVLVGADNTPGNGCRHPNRQQGDSALLLTPGLEQVKISTRSEPQAIGACAPWTDLRNVPAKGTSA